VSGGISETKDRRCPANSVTLQSRANRRNCRNHFQKELITMDNKTSLAGHPLAVGTTPHFGGKPLPLPEPNYTAKPAGRPVTPPTKPTA
jgi:hypothetical protein